ncbi:hypothetical protein CNMCM5878_003938 [Aspergillus fumigatiaffinis]|nr:hypothetical protein CNMCM5878_003938 [Aspergillus fumigatiaffinis]
MGSMESKPDQEYASVPPGSMTSNDQRHSLAHDWDGADDPDNPRNFSYFTRVFSITTVTCVAFISAFAGAIYVPAQEEIMSIFDCSYEIAVLPLSLFNLGLAFGPIIGAPLSEIYGRKAVSVVTTPIFVLFMVGAAVSPTMRDLITCRFFAGIFASPNINNASATILDYIPRMYRGVSLGIYYSIPSLAATLGPLAGGFIVQSRDWRWTQWVAIIMAAATYLPVLLTRESYKGVILMRRARRLGLADSSPQTITLGKKVQYFFVKVIQRPLHMLFTEPIVTLVSCYNGLIFGLIYAYVVSIPWTFKTYYNLGKSAQSLSYLGVSLGSLTACIPFSFIDIFFYQRRLRTWKQTYGSERMLPENRLISAMAASLLLPVSLVVAGWTAHYRVHWMVPILFQGVAMLSCLLIYAGANLFMLDAYGPLYGASASGAMMFSRYFVSFLFPLFSLRMFKRLGVGWATSLLAVLMLLMAPIPWAFWIYGERIRKRSRYETSS